MTELSISLEAYDGRRQEYQRQMITGKIDRQQLEEKCKVLSMEEEVKFTRESSPDFRENNLEWDLRTCSWILEKARSNKNYAQNIYAALCNTTWYKIPSDTTPEGLVEILRDGRKTWSCSWRHAGAIVADMLESGDYMDWYCSGMSSLDNVEEDFGTSGYLHESVVSDEVASDFRRLGWGLLPE